MNHQIPLTLVETADESSNSPATQILSLLQNSLQAFAYIQQSSQKMLPAEINQTIESIKDNYQAINLIINNSRLELFIVDEKTNSLNNAIIELIEQSKSFLPKPTQLPSSYSEVLNLFTKIDNFFLGKPPASTNSNSYISNYSNLLFTTHFSSYFGMPQTSLSEDFAEEDRELELTSINMTK